MNALGVWSLAQLKPGQTAADRPDIFGAYSHMTEAVMRARPRLSPGAQHDAWARAPRGELDGDAGGGLPRQAQG